MKDIKAINAIAGFNGSQFLVRKKILCVLKNFTKMYEEKITMGKLCKPRFILMESPGTDKMFVGAYLFLYRH